MRNWVRYAITVAVGVAGGLAGGRLLTDRGLTGGGLIVGPWQTSLNYGLRETDALTRARVARAGLLALPARETIYWQAQSDSGGAPLDGSCTYRLSGVPMDARWWSITLYDTAGYLMPNRANLWSVNGANIALDDAGRWQVMIAPAPVDGAWLPATQGQGFHLTLRMYNPGRRLRADPASVALPRIERVSCP